MTHRKHLLRGRYQVETELPAGFTAEAFRCTDILTGEVVVCRVGDLEDTKKQWLILRSAAGPGLVPALGFDRDEAGKGVLTLEDAGEQTFAAWATTATFGERLALFERILDAVIRIHKAGGVHGDLHGKNVVVDASAGEVRITLIDPGALSSARKKGVTIAEDASLLVDMFTDVFKNEPDAHPRVVNALHNRSLSEARAAVAALRANLPGNVNVASFVTNARAQHEERIARAKDLTEARIAATTRLVDMIEQEVKAAENGDFDFARERSVDPARWVKDTREAVNPSEIRFPRLKLTWTCTTTGNYMILTINEVVGRPPWPGDLPRGMLATGSLLVAPNHHTITCYPGDSGPHWRARAIKAPEPPEAPLDHAFIVAALQHLLRFG